MFSKTNLKIMIYTVATGLLYLATSGIMAGYKHIASTVILYVFIGFLGFFIGTLLSNIFRRALSRLKLPSAFMLSAITFIFATELKTHLASQSPILQSLFDVPFGATVLGTACLTAMLLTPTKSTSPAKCVDADKY